MSNRRGRLLKSSDRTQSYSEPRGRGRGHHTTSVEEGWQTQSSQTRNSFSSTERQYNVTRAKQTNESSVEENWDNSASYASNSQSWRQNAAPAERDWDRSNEYAQPSQGWKPNVTSAERDWDSNTYASNSQSWKSNAAAPAEKDWDSNTYASTRQNWRQNAAPAEKERDYGSYNQTSQSWKNNAAPAEKDWDNNTSASTNQNWRQTVEPVVEHRQSGSYYQSSSQGWKEEFPPAEENRGSNSYAQSSSWNKGRGHRVEEPVKEEYEDPRPNKSFGAPRSSSGNDWNSKGPAEPNKRDAWDDNSKTSNFSQQQRKDSPAPGSNRIDTMTFSSSRDGHGSRGQWNEGGTAEDSSGEMEMKISSKLLGLIIGKGGNTIRDLQTKSSARVHVDRNHIDSDGKSSITIVGSSSAQSEAKRLIEELIESDQDRQGSSRSSDQFGSRGNTKESDFGTFDLEIPSNCVGKIIGKRGCMINDLQTSSDARIKVARDNTGPITVISITGSSDARSRAEELIKELVEECSSYQNSPKREEGAPQQGRSDWTDSKAPSANRSGCSQNDADNQGDNGNNRAESWRGQSSPAKNRTQWSNDRASDACGDSQNTNGQKAKEQVGLIDWDKIKEADEEFMKVKWQEFPTIKKDFYIEDVDIANLATHEVEAIRRDNNKIMVQHLIGKGGHIPNPIRTFREAFGHYPEIMEEIRKVGFEKPSPIQMQAWPIILKGQDLIGIAQTGTGKTLAFLLPAFIHIEGQPAPRNCRGGANVLVLTPTRELALQIEEEVKKYKYRDIKCVCVYGGGNRKEQISVVTSGVEIIVATPGRLIDLIASKVVDVKSVTYLVLDEADRMLDMGFQPDIRKILLDIRPERQTIMTSATWPVGVRYLATNYMNNPVQVYVGSMDLTACHSVLQRVVMVEEDNKYEELTSLLERELGENDKVIVFIGRKATVDYISTQFVLSEIDCQSIHGGREQVDREQALEDLKSGAVRILLATDVASRGIDIKDITHVINYDFPHNIEEYVHRVGRTGRAGRSGQSITFMTRKDWRYAQELIEIMEEAKQDVPQELYDMAARFATNQERRKAEGGTGGGFGGRGGGGFRRGGGGGFRDDFGGFGGFGGFDKGFGGFEKGGRKGGGGNSFAFSTEGC